MLQNALTKLLAFLAVGALFIGACFLILPDLTLARVDHTSDKLPRVLGGRYLFMGALMVAALLWRDVRWQITLLAGFAGLGFIDALIYWNDAPAPHLAAGILCSVAALVLYRIQKTQRRDG